MPIAKRPSPESETVPNGRLSDPTALTTQALRRDVSALREVLEAEVDGQYNVLLARLDGMDKAIQLLQVMTDRQPILVDGKISNLQKLHEERFNSIATQFSERDTRTEQTQRDSKVAVDAALQAAKEAVGEQNKSSSLAIAKSEAATSKQIDQQGQLISTTTQGINDKIDDLKQRLTSLEGKGLGVGMVGALVVGAVVVITGVIGFVGFLNNHPSTTQTAVPPGYLLMPSPVPVPK